LDFIDECVRKENIRFNTLADIFAGTGVVAECYLKKGKQVIANDLLYSNFVIYKALLTNDKFDGDKIKKYINKFNTAEIKKDNYFSDNFSGTYYHEVDARRIGYVREEIEQEKNRGELIEREYYILIASLLYAMDKIANTVGHYESFLKKCPIQRGLQLQEFEIEHYKHSAQIYNEDANKLVRQLSVDMVYIDPPYNARQYANFYHLLENVARWKKPPVFNKARKMERSEIMSEYSRRGAKEVFSDLIKNVNAKTIVVSYNNTYDAHQSSINMITFEDMVEILERKGKTTIYEKDYKYFETGKTGIKKNTERVFICRAEA